MLILKTLALEPTAWGISLATSRFGILAFRGSPWKTHAKQDA
jgi:hypothetical protein